MARVTPRAVLIALACVAIPLAASAETPDAGVSAGRAVNYGH
jgi:hypothetical protein